MNPSGSRETGSASPEPMPWDDEAGEDAPWDEGEGDGSGAPGRGRRERHDAFTVAKKRKFLRALAKTGCVLDACRAVGVGARTVYRHQERDARFAEYCRVAIDMAALPLELTAWQRAVEGVEQPFACGGQVHVRRRYSDGLLRLLLQAARPTKYGPQLGFTRKRLYKGRAPPHRARGPRGDEDGGEGAARPQVAAGADRGPDAQAHRADHAAELAAGPRRRGGEGAWRAGRLVRRIAAAGRGDPPRFRMTCTPLAPLAPFAAAGLARRAAGAGQMPCV